MTTLPTTFRKNGFNFTQIKRAGQVAIFSKTKPGHSNPTFEVVVIQQHEPFTIHGKPAGDCEALPSNEQWGKFGFTFNDMDRANASFKSLADSNG